MHFESAPFCRVRLMRRPALFPPLIRTNKSRRKSSISGADCNQATEFANVATSARSCKWKTLVLCPITVVNAESWLPFKKSVNKLSAPYIWSIHVSQLSPYAFIFAASPLVFLSGRNLLTSAQELPLFQTRNKANVRKMINTARTTKLPLNSSQTHASFLTNFKM